MWMKGYNEGCEFNNVVDHSFCGRKLKPLMPRPMTCLKNAPTTTTPSLNHVHANDFLSQYHYHHHHLEQNKREQLNGASLPVVVSTRWNPTPEQLRALEELYRRGTRTPSAEQIQHITSQLRRFGNIEGKNVFYWFQNHKARERQKRRRQMDQSESVNIAETPEKKDLAASRTVFEVEWTKNWPRSTNCSTIAEESVSTQRTEKAVTAESRAEGWVLFDEGELQERRNLLERNATWHVMQLPCPSPAPLTHHLINTTPKASAPTSIATTSITTKINDPNLIKTRDLSLFISPHREKSVIHLSNSSGSSGGGCGEDDNCVVEFQTLQLFPLKSGESGNGSSHNIEDKDIEISASAMNANNFTPSQFFEFLPMKDL